MKFNFLCYDFAFWRQMMKTLYTLAGIAAWLAFLFFSCTSESVLRQLLFGALAGLCAYAGLAKKIDLNDSKLYAAVLVSIILSFAVEDLFFYEDAANPNLALYLGAYLLGSVPFGLLLAKCFANVDIKASGSKSIGATNVLRVVRQDNPKLAKRLAVATFACDFLKATLPIFALKIAGFDDNTLWSVGVLAVLGHCFSAYLGFEGGKGVATSAGVMAVLLPAELAIGLTAWFVVGKVFKISSVASLAGLLAFLIASFSLHYEMSINTHAPILVICALIIYKHIPNIRRLFHKEECKVV